MNPSSNAPVGSEDPEANNDQLDHTPEEAEEDNRFIEDDDEGPIEEEGEGEDLFEGDIMADYKAVPELDTYGREGLDSEEYEPIAGDERARAEAAMRRRDRERAGRGEGRGRARLPVGLQSSSTLSDEEGEDREGERSRKRRRQAARAAESAVSGGDMTMGGMEEDEEPFQLDMPHGPVREWIVMNRPRREIARLFQAFLRTYTDQRGNSVYKERIQTMCMAQRMSLEVSYDHLRQVPDLETVTVWLTDHPAEIIKIFDEVALQETLLSFPNYRSIHPEIRVRITDLLEESIREIRQIHLNGLIRVRGVVTRRSGVYPQLKAVKYDCVKCGAVMGPFAQTSSREVKVASCSECQSKGPFNINQEQTVYQSYQRITLQESPGSVPPGRLPRQKEVVLLNDLIDSARPGDEVDVTGIYTNNFDLALNRRNSFPVFATVIEANNISRYSDKLASFALTSEDEKEILELSKRRNLTECIVASIAPSIYGHEDIKLGIALSMFGGVSKEVEGMKIRGDINMLLLGDPGTAKSQFLKYVEKTSHRAVFTTGQGASAVGLTASVRIDPVTREWTLEGGALVLADRGVCLIDEFDKMNDADRTSIHEAMEQQSISIAKAGIVTTLQARCAVIAAANPLKGRYDPSLSFSENVDLTDPILSRFDLLCVVRDTIDPVSDERLASFVVDSHQNSHPDAASNANAVHDSVIPQTLLKKYFVYARERVTPRINEYSEKVVSLYKALREASPTETGMPINVRFLQGLIRLAEAHARMHLRDYVLDEDWDASVRLGLSSYIAAQKTAVTRPLLRKFAKFITQGRDNDSLLLHLLQTLVKENIYMHQTKTGRPDLESVNVDLAEFEARAREYRIHNLDTFYRGSAFAEAGFRLSQDHTTIIRDF